MSVRLGIIAFILIFAGVAGIALFGNVFAKEKFKFAPSLCDEFEYHETKIVCYAYFMRNSSFCSLAPNFEEECYTYSKLPELSLDSCKAIKNEFGRALCISTLGIKKKNFSFCEYLKKPYLREYCLASVLPFFFKYFTENQCNSISHESLRLTCLALVRKSEKYCENITSEPMERDLCFATIRKNTKLCTSDLCKKYMSIFFKDYSLCTQVSGLRERAMCTGIITKNFEECKKIQNIIARDLCRLYVIYAKELDL